MWYVSIFIQVYYSFIHARKLLLMHWTSFFVLFSSVPTFQSLPEEILSKLADVLEEVTTLHLYPFHSSVGCFYTCKQQKDLSFFKAWDESYAFHIK